MLELSDKTYLTIACVDLSNVDKRIILQEALNFQRDAEYYKKQYEFEKARADRLLSELTQIKLSRIGYLNFNIKVMCFLLMHSPCIFLSYGIIVIFLRLVMYKLRLPHSKRKKTVGKCYINFIKILKLNLFQFVYKNLHQFCDSLKN